MRKEIYSNKEKRTENEQLKKIEITYFEDTEGHPENASGVLITEMIPTENLDSLGRVIFREVNSSFQIKSSNMKKESFSSTGFTKEDLQLILENI